MPSVPYGKGDVRKAVGRCLTVMDGRISNRPCGPLVVAGATCCAGPFSTQLFLDFLILARDFLMFRRRSRLYFLLNHTIERAYEIFAGGDRSPPSRGMMYNCTHIDPFVLQA